MQHRGISPAWRVISILLVAAVLLAGLWFVLQDRSAEAPARSTMDARPNSSQNIPPSSDGSVTEDGDPAVDTVPDPDGAGANTLQEQ